MKVLIVGSGGREHALAWKLSAEGHEVCAAPGNPGLAALGTCYDVSPMDLGKMVELCQQIQPTLILVGPEDPLIAGLADALRAAGFDVFGPGKAAAQLEGSKAFSKELMLQAKVPTARSGTFTDAWDAIEFADKRYAKGGQVVVKASGAALGKGVSVCSTFEEAQTAIEDALVRKVFGEAGAIIVVEDRLEGREFSLLTLCSDHGIYSLPVAQDYKRIFDNDEGPNTGGMGTYSPVPWVDSNLVHLTEQDIVRPILTELKSMGIPYRGVLFSGVMEQYGELYCLEYNVRFGDPETQSVMGRLGNGFGAALLACARGEEIPSIPVLDNAVVSVVAAAGGYPGTVEKGKAITVGSLPDGVGCFLAGVKEEGGNLVTNGGRVLAVSAIASDLASARAAAYQGIEGVAFEGMQYRKDVALLSS